MRRLLFLCLFTAACAGPGLTDLEVDWTFGGRACDQAGVVNIDIEIAGENLFPHSFTCAQAPIGVDLGAFTRGTYDVSILGTDANGNAIYSSDHVVQVLGGGTQIASIDVDQLFGDLDFRWTFDGGSCAGAGVSAVTVSIDGVALVDSSGSAHLACSSGGIDGIVVLSPTGTHEIGLDAVDGSGNAYSVTFNETVRNGLTIQEQVDLALVH
jgi:hypothetical protein